MGTMRSPSATASRTAAMTALLNSPGLTCARLPGVTCTRLSDQHVDSSHVVAGTGPGELTDRTDQLRGVERLGDVGVHPDLMPTPDVMLLGPRRDHHDLDPLGVGVLAQLHRRHPAV